MNSQRSEDTADPLRGTVLRAIVGPTAAGKSDLALEIAERSGAEIVALDSMQVYRGMDIGTAKPTAAERARVRHHMLDLVTPDERYDVQRFLRDLAPVLDDLRARGVAPLFVGGTGFYLKVLTTGLFSGPDVDLELRARLMQRARVEGDSVLHGELARVDPAAAARIHPNDTKRVVRGLEVYLQTGEPLSSRQTQWDPASPARARHLVGVTAEPEVLDRRIHARALAMLTAGWPEEAARVRATTGFGESAVQALGYAEALLVHDGSLSIAAAADQIARETRQFARRQRTWYRKFEDIVWLTQEGEKTQRGDLVAAALSQLHLAPT
ncbi:MAG: tRNA (adenosine(37)-N6)-dimethylallyltransferase MiaA [Planctomycetes bacterium]|nr:tRNA (adenosine(37)-N6)-dimethylallyltransferase MiaA [Planctomycetota bacterium]